MAPVYQPDFHIPTPWDTNWQPELIGTLIFVTRVSSNRPQVLLIRKLTGHGRGRVNGPGGKLEEGEQVLEAACRELTEETGLVALNARCVAELRFVERDGPQWLGYACVADEYTGRAIKTEEADPFWCDIAAIPYAQMWPDDALWLPRILQSEAIANAPTLIGNFLFANERLLTHEFVEPPLPASAWRKQLGVC